MEITVDIAERDIIALNDHVVRTIPAIRRRLLLAWLVPPALIAIGGALIYVAGQRAFGIAIVVAGIIVFSGFPVFCRFSRHRNVQLLLRSGSNLNVFGPQRISITPEAIARHNDYGHSAFYWSAVDRIEISDEHGFVFVASVSAMIIPKRDLNVPTFERFMQTAQEYLHRQGGGVGVFDGPGERASTPYE